MSVRVNEPYARSILVKLHDENTNTTETATKDNMLYSNDSYTSSFSVRNNTLYRLEIKLNANSVSEKTYYNTVYVDAKKGVDVENSPVITQTEMNLFESDQMAPGAYTYLMYFTYKWYLADSEKDKKIYADAIRDIRNGEYKRTGDKYWDNIIKGMDRRPKGLDPDIYCGFIRCIANGFDINQIDITNNDLIQFNKIIEAGKEVPECVHYYRNKLNLEFSWDEFQKLQKRLPHYMKWNGNVKNSYHQHNKTDGEYNKKYISACGHFEIVYSSRCIVQNQYNNPLDMGTYNYYDPVTKPELHTAYDVYPYDNSTVTAIFMIISGYGNTADTKGLLNYVEVLLSM